MRLNKGPRTEPDGELGRMRNKSSKSFFEQDIAFAASSKAAISLAKSLLLLMELLQSVLFVSTKKGDESLDSRRLPYSVVLVYKG